MIKLFNVPIASSVLLLVISEAVLLFCCYALTVFWASPGGDDPMLYMRYEGGILRIVIVVAILQLTLYFMDLYDDIRPIKGFTLLQQTSTTLGVAFLLQALIGYGKGVDIQLSKWTMFYGSTLAFVAVPAWRIIFYSLVRNSLPTQQLLFVGISSSILAIIDRITNRPELGLTALGYLNESRHEKIRAPYLGDLKTLDRVLREKRPDRIIVGLKDWQQTGPMQYLLNLRVQGISVEEEASTFESVFGRLSIADLRTSQLVFSSEFVPKPWCISLQRGYSLILGLIGLIVTLPVMLIVGLLVRLTSPGPVLFSQRRVGLHGTVFKIYKFRSMYVDAEAKTGAVWASKNDPRITPVGRWLRLLRLDELPQFVNVVRGEMSLVGPRPERPEFVSVLIEQIPFYNQRHCVLPGVTGWAQINHKYGDTIEDTNIKLEYDFYYIKNLTPFLDLYIILQTIKVMLLFRGAQ